MHYYMPTTTPTKPSHLAILSDLPEDRGFDRFSTQFGATDSPVKPKHARRAEISLSTTGFGSAVQSDDVEAAVTEVVSRKSLGGSSSQGQRPQGSTDAVSDLASKRVRLLAAKYVADENVAEVTARLAILDRRMLQVAPRVSVEQVKQLEDANDLIEQARAAREARREFLSGL